jgi:hypothetical protein
MLLRTVGRESRRSSRLSRDRPALSFSGEIAQIRRTPEGTGVNPLERSCGRQNHESGNGPAGVAFPCSTCRNSLPGALERDLPEAPLNGVEVETTAGNSGKLQFLIPCTDSASSCKLPALWQLSFALAEALARRQFWLAQSGAQVGATSRATIVSKPHARRGHPTIRIRIALGILLLRYAGRQPASTSPWHGAQKGQCFIRRNRASLCRPRLCPRKSDRRK